MAKNAQARFENWAAIEGVRHGDISVSGFPARIKMQVPDISYEKPDLFRLKIPEIIIQILPLNPAQAEIFSEDGFALQLAEANKNFSAEKIHVKLDMLGQHALVDISVLKLDPSINIGFDHVIGKLAFRATPQGALPKNFNADGLEEWRKAGGAINFEDVHVEWHPLVIDGGGTLSFDEKHNPQGSFIADIGGYIAVVDRLVEQGQIKPFAAALFKAVLSILEDKNAPEGAVKDSERKIVKIPIKAQESGLTVAGIHVMRWGPKIDLPKEAQPASPRDLEDDE